MSRNVRFVLLLLCGLVLASAGSAAAQIAAQVRVDALVTEAYPQLTMYASIIDENGDLVPGLTPGQFELQEDGVTLSEISIEEISSPIRQVFVLNSRADMDRNDITGRTYYDHAREALFDWWSLPEVSRFGNFDDLTLVTADAALITHSGTAASLSSVLDRSDPGFADLSYVPMPSE